MLELRIGHTTIELRFLFLAMLTLCLLLDETGIAVMGLLAGTMHECGHLIAVLLTGFSQKRIAFEMTGIRMEHPLSRLTNRKEAVVLLAGSMVNFIMLPVCFFMGWQAFGAAHLVLGVMNLMPFQGLDGGKLLSLLLTRFFSLYKSEKILKIIQIVLNIFISIICILLFYHGRGNPTMLVLCIYLWVSIF